MSTQVTANFVYQWGQTITLLAQQKGSKLRGTVMSAPVTGEAWTTEQIGSVSFSPLTGRHQDTRYVDTPHSRRWGYVQPYVNADLIDRADKVRTLNDPTNPYTQAFIYGAGRTMDDVLITAMDATVVTGKTGTGTQAFDTTNNLLYKDATLQSNGTGSGTALPLTVAKVLRALSILQANDAPDDDNYFFAVHPSSLRNLLYTTKVGSQDYNSVRALQEGTLTKWLGFNWKICTRVATSAANIRRNWAYHKSAMEMGLAEEPVFKIDELPSKNYSTQVYARMDIGAVRKQETLVVAVESDETATASDS